MSIEKIYKSIEVAIIKYRDKILLLLLGFIFYIAYVELGLVLTSLLFSNTYIHGQRIKKVEEKIKKIMYKEKNVEQVEEDTYQEESPCKGPRVGAKRGCKSIYKRPVPD